MGHQLAGAAQCGFSILERLGGMVWKAVEVKGCAKSGNMFQKFYKECVSAKDEAQPTDI